MEGPRESYPLGLAFMGISEPAAELYRVPLCSLVGQLCHGEAEKKIIIGTIKKVLGYYDIQQI
jgi:hypothetical protein